MRQGRLEINMEEKSRKVRRECVLRLADFQTQDM